MTNPQYDLNRYLLDLRMAGILKYCKVLTGQPVFLKEACFKYYKPHDISEYERVFNYPLRFNHLRNQLVFNQKETGTPVL
ncbi:AraC family transcriptional regulator ligand-binding domain-containing protein [Dethiosulfatarculus sandiegensis]|uniref:HTH-type transcriptional regulator AraC-type N-terminal domain-containing protein n=1 Tax=Dethiosulfatarculus sandiegensis TaxID=1429043 RepID=A0A0D2HMD6_9BACT|nr:hypothetical protein X474_22880 [Dethiosulfatarculus sandiegensis]